jgi:single-strand DNA-binding protein
MASLNKVMLIGNLTRDPEVRYTPGGRPVCDLRLAVSRRFKRANGEDGEETCFVSVTVWDKQGENCGKYLTKGSPAFVEGRLQLDEWEKDGKKFSTLRVLAERVQFLGARPRGEGDDGPAGDHAPRANPSGPARRPAPPPARPAGDDEPPPSDGAPSDDENLPF